MKNKQTVDFIEFWLYAIFSNIRYIGQIENGKKEGDK